MRARDLAAAGRSLATGALVGRGRGEPERLLPLVAPVASGVADDPDRAATLDALATTASLAELQAAMAAGAVTSEELTGHLLRRAFERDTDLNCLISLNPAALDEAMAADARRAAGEASPLLGIPVTIKDNIETGPTTPTTAGAAILLDHHPAGDAPVVTALRTAGAVVLGKANLSELAGAVVKTPGFSAVGGQTVNPYGTAFSPGGSSSGSAVSVAAGLAPLSVGTETSGSLIAPAAFNGVVGMKPSRGAVASAGIIPLIRHQDSAGPVARSVADAAALLAVLSGGRVVVDLASASLDGVRVGVLAQDILEQHSALEDTADSAGILTRIEDGLRSAGAEVVRTTVAKDEAASVETALLTVIFGGLAHDTVGYLAACDLGLRTLADLHAWNMRDARRRMPKGQFLLDLALARGVTRDAYEAAAAELGTTAARTLEAAFDAAGADLLASVSHAHSPLYASAGWPAITVPLGLRASWMPTGVTLIGRPGADGALLAWAHAFEQATRLRRAPELP